MTVARERVDPILGSPYASLSADALQRTASGKGAAAPVRVLPSSLVEVLDAAAAQVRASWEREGRDGHTTDDVVQPLAEICQAVCRAVAGGTPEMHGIPPTLAARRMVDLLRRAVLARLVALDSAPTGDDVVALLSALERTQEVLARDAAQRFASHLSGADGLQLIVEVAHDMRSPLGSILFLAERLRSGQSGAVAPIQERQLGLVYSAALGLSSLASDVIELARGGDRLLDHHPIPFSIGELLQSVRDIVQPIAEEKGLVLQFTPPETDSRLGYPAALNRVLLNLTTNALKFTASGSVEVVCRQLSRSAVEFCVTDTGRGIPPVVLDTLFDAFRRRQRPGDYTFSSAGLGLSICQKLVLAMKGELKVETELERGTRFRFTLDLPPTSSM